MLFLLFLVWSVGKTGFESSQAKFSAFLEAFYNSIDCIESEFKSVWNALLLRGWKKPDFHTSAVKGILTLPMPMRSDYYECIYSPEDSKWKNWTDLLPQYTIQPGSLFSTIMVPNSYSGQYSYLIELLVPYKRHILMCGPTGTGKSVYIASAMAALPNASYKPLSLGFSAKTSANMTQDIVDGKLDKRRKGIYGPPMGSQCILFIDDLNMPEVETYGAQPPIELVRQLIDNGGWYDLKEKSWREIIDTSLIAAMGPPGGEGTTLLHVSCDTSTFSASLNSTTIISRKYSRRLLPGTSHLLISLLRSSSVQSLSSAPLWTRISPR